MPRDDENGDEKDRNYICKGWICNISHQFQCPYYIKKVLASSCGTISSFHTTPFPAVAEQSQNRRTSSENASLSITAKFRTNHYQGKTRYRGATGPKFVHDVHVALSQRQKSQISCLDTFRVSLFYENSKKHRLAIATARRTGAIKSKIPAFQIFQNAYTRSPLLIHAMTCMEVAGINWIVLRNSGKRSRGQRSVFGRLRRNYATASEVERSLRAVVDPLEITRRAPPRLTVMYANPYWGRSFH